MFIAALFMTATGSSSVDGHGRKLNVHQQMNGLRRYGTYIQWNTNHPLKNNKTMSFVVTWMELELLILSEVSQKEKDNTI